MDELERQFSGLKHYSNEDETNLLLKAEKEYSNGIYNQDSLLRDKNRFERYKTYLNFSDDKMSFKFNENILLNINTFLYHNLCLGVLAELSNTINEGILHDLDSQSICVHRKETSRCDDCYIL